MHLRHVQLAIKGLEAPVCCGLCWASPHPLPERSHNPSAGWAVLHVQSHSTMGTVALAAGPSLSRSFLSSAMVALLYTAPNSTKLITGAAGCFGGVSVGAGTGRRGMEVSMSNWKFSTPWCTSTCCALKVALSTLWEIQMPGEMTTDNSKCQILIVLFLVILQPAKPAWLQHGGHLQAQHLPTHTQRHTVPANAKTASFSREAEPQQPHDMANSV